MKNKVKLPKPPRPEVCDACFLESNLVFNSDCQEWLCTQCNELIKQDSREFDYGNGKNSDDGYEW